MSSIRPLVTITILVVVGAYLYVKINEGSLQPAPEAGQSFGQTPEGVPPLATASAPPAVGETAAPAWNAGATTAPSTATTDATAEVATATPEATTQQPAMPAMPEMPELATAVPSDVATTTQPVAPQTPGVTAPVDLPASIPEARYPDQAATNANVGATTPPGTTTPPTNVASDIAQPVAPQAAPTQATATTPEEMNAATTAAAGGTAPLAAQPNPLRQSPPPTQDAGRYDTYTTAPPLSNNAVSTSNPTEPSFVESWPAIQAMLQRGELTEAHTQLSRWYGDPSLTPTDAERVETLLSELAGTIVYSTEHRLAPPHVVKQGETLETIAKEYNVPWQLLAKVNGVAAPDQVRPGQELKVVRGPFAAVVDLTRNQLTLTIDGRYAGKFPVGVAPGQAIGDGQWIVEQKSPPSPTDRAIVLREDSAAPPTAAAATPRLTISSAAPSNVGAGATIQVSAKDAEDLSDILSIGSRVITRR